ncbi:MAG: hypothetical protein PVF97_01570, partial [Desulfobacterales bacterium]
MKPTLTSTPKKALWWIIAALLIALMPSVALSGSIHFAIVNISSVSPVAEGSTDHFITIDVQMTGILLDGDTATVDYVLQDGSATSSDYADGASGQVSITAPSGNLDGDTSTIIVSIPVTIKGDTIVESDENFQVQLSSAESTESNTSPFVDATVDPNPRTIEIADDDTGATVSIAAGPVVSTEGTDTTATFALTLGGTSVQ